MSMVSEVSSSSEEEGEKDLEVRIARLTCTLLSCSALGEMESSSIFLAMAASWNEVGTGDRA